MFGTYLAGWANLEEPDLSQYYGFFVWKEHKVSFKMDARLKYTKANKEKRGKYADAEALSIMGERESVPKDVHEKDN